MRLAREAGSPVLAVTNIMGSQATREADYVLFTRAGLEIGVAATKTHTAQVAAMLLLALRLAWARGAQTEAELKRLGHELRAIPEKVEQLLAWDQGPVMEIAGRYHDERFFLYLGRGMGFAVCLEGALKLKEISYIPTEAYAAGEMKHGPIALLEQDSPVVVVADDSPVFPKLVSNIEEVRARGADVIAVATEGNETIAELSRDVLWVPAHGPSSGAHPDRRPAAAAGVSHRRHQRVERRSAAQPREDRDGGIGVRPHRRPRPAARGHSGGRAPLRKAAAASHAAAS